MDTAGLDGRLELAVAAARKAGRATLEHFCNRDLRVDSKRDGTPVTVADREAEELLRARIGQAFPDDAIIGEEFPEKPGTSGYRWFFDPIDGTKSFIHGVPLYGTLAGVEYEGRCVLGVIVLPGLDEYVYAARGQGCWHARGAEQPRRARVSAVSELGESLFCTTSVTEFVLTNRLDAYEALRARCKLARGWGDCYGYVLIATGRAEVMVEPRLNLWDMAPLPVILEEAGGTFTDWKGKPTIHSGEGMATNGHVLEQVLAITRER